VTAAERALEIVRRHGIVRPRDLEPEGVTRATLQELHRTGLLIRSGRGIYVPADFELTEHHTLAEVCKRVPHAVVCLASALQFHEITTQSPPEVWITIESRARSPRVDYPPVQIIRASGAPFHAGVEEHRIEGVRVPVYSLPKTVADCFRYRGKIGLDVALEVLRECLRDRRCSHDDLHHYGAICRVENVMRPYLEALA
jgi:predicted transcriptional regulator of viral defense system